MNDNFDTAALNAEFHKDRETRTATLVATRDIRRGEEIYASYGESYWSARGIDPITGHGTRGGAGGGQRRVAMIYFISSSSSNVVE